MNYDDENASVEHLCYTELPINKPCSVVRPEEIIQIAPIVQSVTINAVINASSNSQTAMTPDGRNANGIDSGITPSAILSEKKSKKKTNLIAGIVMLIVSVVVLLPFIFSLDGVSAKMVNLFAAVPGLNFQGSMNAIQNLIYFFTNTSEMALLWKSTIPSFLLAIGLIFVIFNIFKSVFSIFGAIKPRRYTKNSIITIGFFGIVVVLQLFGVESIGLPKIDFLQQVVYGWKYSQAFMLIAISLVNFFAACICAIFIPKKSTVNEK